MIPGGKVCGDKIEEGGLQVQRRCVWPQGGNGLAGAKLTADLSSQETHSACTGSSPGGSSFVVPGALHVSRPRGHSVLVAGERSWGQESRPASTPLAFAHRSVAAPPCGGEAGWGLGPTEGGMRVSLLPTLSRWSCAPF